MMLNKWSRLLPYSSTIIPGKWLIPLLPIFFFAIGSTPLHAQIFSQERFDNMILSKNIQDTDTQKITAIIKKGQALIDTHIDSASRIFQQTLAWSKQIQYNRGIAKSILNIANCERLKGYYMQALYTAKQSAVYCLSVPDFEYALYYYKSLSEIYADLGYIDSAIHYCYRALDRMQDLAADSTYDQFKWYFNARLGSLFTGDGYNDFYRSLYYLGLSEELAKMFSDKKYLIRTYLSLGAAYANRAKRDSVPGIEGYQKGIYYYQQAALLSKEIGNDINLGDAYFNQGTIYINRSMVDSGEYFIRKAMEIPAYVQFHMSKISSYAALGVGYFNAGKYKKAEQYLLVARNQSRAIRSHVKLLELEKILYLLYVETKSKDKAFTHLKAYTELRDSMIDKEKINAIARQEVKYRTAEKARELALKNLSLTRQQSQLREKNIWIGAGALSTLLLICLLFLLRRNSNHRRQRQEEKLRLMEQEQQLWKQGEEIRQLNAMVKGEEKERARLGRELHDGIVGQLAVAKMNFLAIQNRLRLPEPDNDFMAALFHLDETALELRKTAHNLMPEILIHQGLVTALDSFCEKTSTFTGVQIDFHLEGFVPKLDTDFALSVYRMVQELVQNIIKHAKATKALVQLNYHEPLLIVTVEDDGIGIENNNVKYAKGMGLSTIETRVKGLKGNFEILGNKGEGTSIYIEFDISLLKQDIEI